MVNDYFTSRNHHSPLFTPPPVMGCGAAEATGLGFVCFVVINPCVSSVNRVVFFLFHKLYLFFLEFQIIRFMPIFFIEISFVLPPPPQPNRVHITHQTASTGRVMEEFTLTRIYSWQRAFRSFARQGERQRV